jgi:hypothetical protein
MFTCKMVHKVFGRKTLSFDTWEELYELLSDKRYMRFVQDYEVVEVGKVDHTATRDRFNALFA